MQVVRVSQLILVMPVTLVFFIKIPRQTSMSKSQRKPGAPSTDPPSALRQSRQLWGLRTLCTILYVWETTSLHSTQPEDAKDTALGCQTAAFESLAGMGWKIFLRHMHIRVQNLIHSHPRISDLTSWHSFLGLAPHRWAACTVSPLPPSPRRQGVPPPFTPSFPIPLLRQNCQYRRALTGDLKEMHHTRYV